MLHRLKTALVDSYVGAVALGYLLGEGVEEISTVFIAPFSEWVQLKELHRILPQGAPDPGFGPLASLPHLAHGIFYVLIALALLRWLYYPAKVETLSRPDGEEAAF
jgi:hypothetical protein